MNYANIKKLDVSNHVGISASIFFSGCYFHCEGCFNKEAQDFNYGKPFTKEVEDLFISYVNNPNVVSSNLLGGEIFHQDLDVMYKFVKRLKEETNKPIIAWSGFTFEEIIKDPNKIKILELIDILIDGQFKLELKDLKLKHRGSSNQRVINVPLSIKENKVIEVNGLDD